MVRIRIWRVQTEDAPYPAIQVFERDWVPRLIDHERNAVLRINRADEEVTGLGDLHVLAETNTEGERIAVEVRQKTGQRPARSVGLHRRPLARQTNNLRREGLQCLAIEDRPRDERLIGTINLEQVGTAHGDSHHETYDAGAAYGASRPLILESGADLVES